MKWVIPFTPRNYHPLARASHDRLLPDAERVDVSKGDDAYWRLLGQLWGGEEFGVVEHDIEVTEAAIQEAEECECLWASSPYRGPGHGLLLHSLGFVRFRQELLRAVPQLMGVVGQLKDSIEVAPGHWRRLDARTEGTLRDLEQRCGVAFAPHTHSEVLHHHVYQDPERQSGWFCACGQDHSGYPYDREGRYDSRISVTPQEAAR